MRYLVALAAALLCACASHNSHRVFVNPNEELAPMIEDALGRMEIAWGQILPRTGVDLAVRVEPVAVHWVLPTEPGQPTPVLDEAQMRDYVEEAVRSVASTDAGGGQGDYLLRVSMAVDMHQPDELLLQFTTSVASASDPGRVLAAGASGCLELARLYCHGCHEEWGGKGSDLRPSAEYGGGDFAAGVFFHTHSPSPGYSKH